MDLYFFVMENLFNFEGDQKASTWIQDRYDIKGSHVNRSAKPPNPGQTVTCRSVLHHAIVPLKARCQCFAD